MRRQSVRRRHVLAGVGDRGGQLVDGRHDVLVRVIDGVEQRAGSGQRTFRRAHGGDHRSLLTDRLRGGLKEAGIPALPGTGPIVAVPVPGAGVAVTAARRLRGAGLFAPAIRYPTVPRGGEIVRVTLMATHTEEQLVRAAEVVGSAVLQARALVEGTGDPEVAVA